MWEELKQKWNDLDPVKKVVVVLGALVLLSFVVL